MTPTHECQEIGDIQPVPLERSRRNYSAGGTDAMSRQIKGYDAEVVRVCRPFHRAPARRSAALEGFKFVEGTRPVRPK
jgi:hypothetical protein